MERNPYLVLGVDFGASGADARRAFAHAARRVRREGGAWAIEDLNWALHEIDSYEGDPFDDVSMYRVPADPRAFEPVGVGLFRPPAVRLERLTAPDDREERAALERAAAIEVDDMLLGAIAEALELEVVADRPAS